MLERQGSAAMVHEGSFLAAHLLLLPGAQNSFSSITSHQLMISPY